MNKRLSRLISATIAAGLLLGAAQPAAAGFFASAEEKRTRLDLSAKHTLEKLLATDAKAQRLYDRAFGYAVFNVTKGALIVSGGGGSGVAVHKSSTQRTYMHVGLGGIGLGIGGQAFRMVLLFEDEHTFNDFIDSQWLASSSANAVAGRNGANAEASFTNGLAVYQMTDAGLFLAADIAGARYWRANRLNASADAGVRTAAADTITGYESTDSVYSAPATQYDYETQTTVYPLETTSYETVSEYQSQ
ncbi:MAG: hypothetical protein KJO54_11425 [Gammaproteobacteria bacterium]|nr:hypothetical protein [Gammaproteobacteria bacterium]